MAMLTNKPNRILKADTARALGDTALFQYDDLQHRCRRHVEQARQHARQLVDDARAESQSIRQQAYEQALAAGRAEALVQAESEIERRAATRADELVAERVQSVLPALRKASAELAVEYDRWLTHWENSAARLCVAIAEKLVRHELRAHPETANDMIAAALRLVAGQPAINVRLNPIDLERLGNQADAFVKSMASNAEVTVLPDATIDPSGCKIETRHGQIDATLSTLLDRITAELIA